MKRLANERYKHLPIKYQWDEDESPVPDWKSWAIGAVGLAGWVVIAALCFLDTAEDLAEGLRAILG